MIRVVCLLLVLGLPAKLAAQSALDAEERLLAAAGLLDAAESAGDRVGALTDAVLAYDAALSAIRSELRDLTLQERRLASELAQDEADIAALLAVMHKVSANAETESLLYPGSAVDAIRAGSLARAAIPTLHAEASQLQDRLTALQETKAVISASNATLKSGLRDVQTARTRLATALAERQVLPPRLATNEAAMDALVNSAETLSALADSFFANTTPPEGVFDVAWVMPVEGQLRAPFEPRNQRPGWSFATEPEALVVSPTASTVRFSRKLPNSGHVVILEADGRRLIVVAGLSASFVGAGQVVAQGEAVGFAAKGQMAAQDNLNAKTGESNLIGNETVYIEIRQGGVPINPAALLTWEQEQG